VNLNHGIPEQRWHHIAANLQKDGMHLIDTIPTKRVLNMGFTQ